MTKKAIAKNAIINGKYYMAVNESPLLTAKTSDYFDEGTEVTILEERDEWSKVSGLNWRGETSEGWVRTKYLE